MNNKWPSLVAGALLFLGILNIWPYGYYILLRWVVCCVAIINTISFNNVKLTGWVLVFVAIAFLFNPIIPVYMDKSSWVGIDLIGAVIFFLTAYSNEKTNEKN